MKILLWVKVAVLFNFFFNAEKELIVCIGTNRTAYKWVTQTYFFRLMDLDYSYPEWNEKRDLCSLWSTETTLPFFLNFVLHPSVTKHKPCGLCSSSNLIFCWHIQETIRIKAHLQTNEFIWKYIHWVSSKRTQLFFKLRVFICFHVFSWPMLNSKLVDVVDTVLRAIKHSAVSCKCHWNIIHSWWNSSYYIKHTMLECLTHQPLPSRIRAYILLEDFTAVRLCDTLIGHGQCSYAAVLHTVDVSISNFIGWTPSSRQSTIEYTDRMEIGNFTWRKANIMVQFIEDSLLFPYFHDNEIFFHNHHLFCLFYLRLSWWKNANKVGNVDYIYHQPIENILIGQAQSFS